MSNKLDIASELERLVECGRLSDGDALAAATEIREQQAEIERLSEEVSRLRMKCGPDEMTESEYYTLAKLEEDNERLRADAERLEWLINHAVQSYSLHPDGTRSCFKLYVGWPEMRGRSFRDAIDNAKAAVDAAKEVDCE